MNLTGYAPVDHAYAGPDRRSTGVTLHRPGPRPFVAAALLVGAGFAAAAAGIAWSSPGTTDPGVERVTTLLTTATAVVTGVVAVTSLVRWRMVGDTASLRFGLGTAVLAMTVSTLGRALPSAAPDLGDIVALQAVQLSAMVTTSVVLWTAIRQPHIDTRVRPGILSAQVLGALAAGATLIASVAVAVPVAIDRAAEVFAPGLWGALSAVYAWSGFRHGRRSHAWFALALLALALGSLTRLVSPTASSAWTALPPGMELATMGLGLRGVGQDMTLAWRRQQQRLLEAETECRVAGIRRRIDEAAARERAHDARSALLAIQGAAADLERWGLDLHDESHASLARALAAEARRLQRLVDHRPTTHSHPVVFDLRDTLGAVVTCRQSTELGLKFEVPNGLCVVGDPDKTAEVVANLLDNAAQHAPGSPVIVRATVELDNVVVRIEDRGPGIDPTERETLFETGRRGAGTPPTGSGLGLSVARRLMREQGGDVWAEGRPGGGASFVLALPAPTPDLQSSAGHATRSAGPLVDAGAHDEGREQSL